MSDLSGIDATPARFDEVLLPMDGSTEAAAALPTARSLCERFDARLLVLSVATDASHEARLREELAQRLGESNGAETVEVLVGAEPAQVIVDRMRSLAPSVVCMSTRGRGRVAGSLLGSVTRSVIRLSNVPLVVVGPHADRPGWLVGRPRRRPDDWPQPLSTGVIAAAVDGSSETEAVLPEAARWAAALGMPLSVVTVAEDVAPDLSGSRRNRFGPRNPQDYVDELALQSTAAGVHARGDVVFDPIGIASGLRSYLSNHDVGLLALTTRARTGLDRLRYGATSAQIVAASTVPVLVVPIAEP